MNSMQRRNFVIIKMSSSSPNNSNYDKHHRQAEGLTTRNHSKGTTGTLSASNWTVTIGRWQHRPSSLKKDIVIVAIMQLYVH